METLGYVIQGALILLVIVGAIDTLQDAGLLAGRPIVSRWWKR